MSQSIALITGASSGIGAATAMKFAQQGLYILLVARRLDRLERQAEEIRQAGGKADIEVIWEGGITKSIHRILRSDFMV